MSVKICLPKVNDTMTEATLMAWRVAEGGDVQKDQVVAELAVDLDTVEIRSQVTGTVVSLAVSEGAVAQVGDLLLVVSETQVDVDRGSVVPASPAARKLARDLGVDLAMLHGSGPAGRIVLADVERSRSAATSSLPQIETLMTSPAGDADDELQQGAPERKSVKLRRLLARKMEEAWKTIPHFYVTVTVDMTDVIRFRKDLGFTINDFVLAAISHTLQEQPWVNSLWNGERGIEQAHVDLAMAVESERGLYYPVIRHCEDMTLRQLSDEAARLADRAHEGTLDQAEMDDATFTMTNMGMLGVESFCAIITPPQAAVLAVGTVKGEIVVDDQGEPAVAPIMRLTLSADHRILDGADAAGFLGTVKSYLEAPIVLIAE